MKRMIGKLRSRAGETISETLVALLISSLALVMLAGAIGAAGRMITSSKAAMMAYYSSDRDMAEHAGGAAAGGGNVALSLTGGAGDGAGSVSGSYDVKYYQNKVGGTEVFSYVSVGD